VPVVTVTDTASGAGSAASPLVILRTYKATDAGGNVATAVQTITVTDSAPPTITAPAAVVADNDAGSCTATLDPGTATAADNCGGVTVAGARSDSQPLGAPYPKGVTTITWTATDAVGNTATAQQTVTVNDTEKPAVTVPADIVVTLPPTPSSATSMAVTYAVTSLDNCDGVLTPVVSPASGSSFGVGTTTVTATATDSAGNVTTRTFEVTVLYNFAGFFQPISENPGVLNQVKAGQSVPMKFSLSGDKGLGVLAAPPVSVQIACPGNPTINDVSEVYTLAAGGSGLGYDALADQYKYVWKTESSWVNTCRQFILRLNDGSEHTANFKFK
jgi:hypothetical protein